MGSRDSEAVWELNPLSLSPAALYAVLFLAGLVETAFPPFPGDVLTVLASFALARQNGSVVAGLALSSSGSYLGGLVLWGLATQWSTRSSRALSRCVDAGGIVRAQRLLVRHGVLLVVVSRFIPGIRSLILVAAGLARMPFRQVAWALGVAVMLWQSIVVIGGYLAGEHWLRIVSVWTKVGVALLLIAVLAGYLWWRSTRTAPPGGVDDSG